MNVLYLAVAVSLLLNMIKRILRKTKIFKYISDKCEKTAGIFVPQLDLLNLVNFSSPVSSYTFKQIISTDAKIGIFLPNII